MNSSRVKAIIAALEVEGLRFCDHPENTCIDITETIEMDCQLHSLQKNDYGKRGKKGKRLRSWEAN